MITAIKKCFNIHAYDRQKSVNQPFKCHIILLHYYYYYNINNNNTFINTVPLKTVLLKLASLTEMHKLDTQNKNNGKTKLRFKNKIKSKIRTQSVRET